MISITAGIRKLAEILAGVPGIPSKWIQDIQKIREKAPEDRSEGLIRQRVHDLKTKVEDKPVKRPGLFIRDIGRLINYVEKEVKDPTKQGLKQILVDLSNDVSVAAKKGEFILPKDRQIEILESAGKLKDTGNLLKLIADLFSEVYEGIRKSMLCKLSDLLRGICSAVESLETLYSVIPEGYLKSALHRILFRKPSEAELQQIYTDLKTKIKVMPAKEAAMFRSLLLELIQVQMGKKEKVNIDHRAWQENFDKLKTMTKEEWSSLERAMNLQEEGLTRGVPRTQIRPHTQKMPSTC